MAKQYIFSKKDMLIKLDNNLFYFHAWDCTEINIYTLKV